MEDGQTRKALWSKDDIMGQSQTNVPTQQSTSVQEVSTKILPGGAWATDSRQARNFNKQPWDADLRIEFTLLFPVSL